MAETVSVRKLVSLTAPLFFIAMLIRQFGLENGAFLQLAIISFSGFVVHYFLPFRYRLRFFLALSVGTLGFLLGPGPAAWLIGLSLVLIGLCHLPVSFWLRVVLIVLVGAALGVSRAGFATTPWPAAIWPILGSMFMFRLVVYLYDVRHKPALASLWPTLWYFFLLPNVCFPLFPVVDYSTFRRTYYNEERHQIYRVGVQWIFRGVIHLLLYRIVYQLVMLDPTRVADAVDLSRYMLWPFLLYLRVSGQFHIIVGILHLFGFNLPETHHSYYLTASFTDFWRRINIYWKDFMMKMFYYPAYFALRKRGETIALVLSTVLVFVVTWSLHAYQWFWIRGSFLLAWNDVLFWAILAFFVVINSLYEWRRGRQRALTPRSLSWRRAVGSAAQTVGMFFVICVLWSLWSTESVSVWLSLWSAATQWPASGQWRTLLWVLAVPGAVFVWAIAESRAWVQRIKLPDEAGAALGVLSAACLILLSSSTVYNHLGSAGTLIASVRYGGLNQADAVNMERGYYENLMGVDKFNGELWALYMNRPPDWAKGIIEAGLARPAEALLPYELIPRAEGHFKGVSFKTNQWGMHDKDYTRERPAGCYRFVLLGASHAMGSGVEDGQTFEAVLEDRLNRETEGTRYRCYEILNLAVYGYNPVNQIEVLETKVLDFAPNAILYVGHPEDSRRVASYLAQRIATGQEVPYADLSQMARDAGVDKGTSERVASQRLAPLGEQMLSLVYRRLVADSRSHGLCTGFVFLPMVPDMAYRSMSRRKSRSPRTRDSPFSTCLESTMCPTVIRCGSPRGTRIPTPGRIDWSPTNSFG